jgi:hypothetical protein
MYIIVALTAVVGVSVLTSNRRQKERVSALSFSLAIFGSALWVLFVQLFRNATSEVDAGVFHQAFAVASLLIPLGCLLYAISLLSRKALAIIVSVAAFLGVALVGALILLNSQLFYTDIVLSAGNNYAILADGFLTTAYFGVFGVYMALAIAIIIAKAIMTKKDANLRQGLIRLGCGIALSTAFSSAFSVVLPIIGSYELFWLGPLSVAVITLFVYFVTLRYRLFISSSSLLRLFTYLVVVAIASILYVCLFYLVFTLVFRGAAPSDEILFFHFIMMILVILTLPSINHTIEYIKKIISDNGSERPNETE